MSGSATVTYISGMVRAMSMKPTPIDVGPISGPTSTEIALVMLWDLIAITPELLLLLIGISLRTNPLMGRLADFYKWSASDPSMPHGT
jgi:hypothetical protein